MFGDKSVNPYLQMVYIFICILIYTFNILTAPFIYHFIY